MSDFWSIKITDLINFAILLATIAAIIYGPVLAVELTRKKDRERAAEDRKRLIFSVLMRTRKMPVHFDHVGALNQIQLEFHGHAAVLQAYRLYLDNLSTAVPPAANALENFIERRNDLLYDLLHEISIVVGTPIDRRDLDRLAYMPVGWNTEEEEIRSFRKAMMELLNGRTPLRVAPFQGATQNPFPPPPPTIP